MPDLQHYDVTIIGAGIAGTALAASLSDNGLSIALVEAQSLPTRLPDPPPSASGFDARVSALTPKSQSMLARIGVWPDIAAQRLCSYDHMTVWDAEGTAVLEFDAGEVGVPVLGHIVENRVIVNALLDRVRDCPDVALLNPAPLVTCARLESGAIELEVEGQTAFTSDLLVAADGARSKVRSMMEFNTREWDYGHRAIVTTVQVGRPHQATAWQRFLPSGPLAFLPLPDIEGQHYCSIVWSLEDSLVDEVLALDEAEFCRQLERAIEARLGPIKAASDRIAFPLRQRHAVDYVQPGVALVGDAAHTIHPLAGQGINLGLQDVSALAEEVLASVASGSGPGELAALKRYQRRRKGENLSMMAAMDGFKRLFAERSLPVRWLRNAGMRGVGRIAPIKVQLMRRAMGIGG